MELQEAVMQKAKAYQPFATSLDAIRKVPLLFAAGISGAGKDTVLKRLMGRYPEAYEFFVSYTTRKMRANRGVSEQNGVEYYFIDFTTADHMLDNRDFVEVNCFADNVYGTGIAEIVRAKDRGKILIKDVDVNGIDNYVSLHMNVKPVFVLPPSFEVWWQRLTVRYHGSVDQSNLEKRMKIALDELTKALNRDYFYLVVNDDLEHTVEAIHDITEGKQTERRPAEALEIIHHIADGIETKLREMASDSDPL